jgi:hypothetical protein
MSACCLPGRRRGRVAALLVLLASFGWAAASSRQISCGSEPDDLAIVVRFDTGSDVECVERPAGWYTCTGGDENLVEADCELGCDLVRGDAGCFAAPNSFWDDHPGFTPPTRSATVSCGHPESFTDRPLLLKMAKEDQSCALSKAGHGVYRMECGYRVPSLAESGSTWIPTLRASCRIDGPRSCEAMVGSTDQRDCNLID